MANTLTDLKDVRIAQAALMPWMTELMPLSIFSTNFGPTSADKGDTVKVPVVGAPSPSSDFDGNYVKNIDSEASTIPVVLNKHKFKTVHMTAKEAATTAVPLLEKLVSTAAQQLAIDVLTDIFSAIKKNQFATATDVASAEDFSYKTVLKIREACNKAKMPKAGVLSAITMPCRTNTTGSICTTPVYLSIWQRMQPGDTEFTWIGTSSNTAAQSVGLSSRWEFDNLELNGEDIRICPVNDAELHWDENYVLGGRAIACNDTASSGCRIFSSTANSNHLLELHFEMSELHQRFTPGSHADDNTIHLTPTEHAELSQLLANKDALLALLASQ